MPVTYYTEADVIQQLQRQRAEIDELFWKFAEQRPATKKLYGPLLQEASQFIYHNITVEVK